MMILRSLLKRDLLLAYRCRSESINSLLFFVIIVTLFPLAINPESNQLKIIGAGIIWIAALLATLLSLDSLFRSDFEDGTLEQFLLSPYSLEILMLIKIFAHWLLTGLPLIIVTPILGLLLHLPVHAILILMLSLLLGTPVLSLIGAIGIALTVRLRQGGVLLALITLPLYIPVLVFGAGAATDAVSGFPVMAALAILSALLILALTLAPFAVAGALRASMD